MTVYVKKEIDRVKTGEPVHPKSIARADGHLEDNIDRMITHVNTEIADLNGDKTVQFFVEDTTAPTSDTTADDKTTNSNDGSLNGDPVWKSEKIHDFRGGLEFDGNDSVEVTDAAAFDFGTGDMSGSCRVSTTSNFGSAVDLITKGDPTAGPGFSLQITSSNAVQISIGDGTNTATITSSATVNDGDFHSVEFTVDRSVSTLALYLDGVQEGTADISGFGSLDNTDNLFFGSSFVGIMDGVRLWDVAKTQTELQNQMNIRLTGAEANLVGFWPLDDRANENMVINLGSADSHYTTDTSLKNHSEDTGNPHSVTKSQVGLGNVTNDLQLTKTTFDDHVASNDKHGLNPTSQRNASDEPDAFATNQELVRYMALHEDGSSTRMRARIGRARRTFIQSYMYYDSNNNEILPTFILFNFHSHQPVIFNESVVSSWFEPRSMDFFSSVEEITVLGADIDYRGRTFILIWAKDTNNWENPVLLTLDRFNDLNAYTITHADRNVLKDVVDLCVDSNDTLIYVTNTSKIGKLDIGRNNDVQTMTSFNTSLNSENNRIYEIAADQSGNVFIAVHGRLIKMNYEGTVENEIARTVYDVVVNKDNTAIYTREQGERIVKYDFNLQLQWEKSLNSVQAVQDGGTIAVNDKDEVFANYLSSVDDVDGDYGQYKSQTYEVIKLNSQGGTMKVSPRSFSTNELQDQGYDQHKDYYKYMKLDIDMDSNVYLFHASNTGDVGSQEYKVFKLNNDLEFESENMTYFTKDSLSQTDLNSGFSEFGVVINALVEPGKIGAGHWKKAP